MKKTQMLNCLKHGGSFTVEVNHKSLSDILPLAEAVAEGCGFLTFIKTERMVYSEILALCDVAKGHVLFPEVKIDNWND